MPLLHAGRARVVTLTSVAARVGGIDWDDLQGERRYAPVRAYSSSKLANLLFALELERRSTARGWRITSMAAPPGTTLTKLYASGPNLGRTRPACHEALVERLARWGLVVQSVDAGLLPPLYAATSPVARSGRLYGPDGLSQLSGGPKELTVYRLGRDEADAARLWEISEALTGVTYGGA
ncbi:hypothetical protein [Streptomyces niveus]|uniref:hypothetical protein n=1 Tax=Streptomyces niveus TaxID=193462 RepID=UPI00341D65A6